MFLLVESEAALEQEEERAHQLNTEEAKLQFIINNLQLKRAVSYHSNLLMCYSITTCMHHITIRIHRLDVFICLQSVTLYLKPSSFA